MSVELDIDRNMKEAMRRQDAVTLSALRMVKSALHNEAIARKLKELPDEVALAVLRTQAKKRREAALAFRQGDRPSMADQEEAELKIIEAYLPAQLDRAAVEQAVQKVIGKLGAGASYGQVMGAAMKELRGTADGKTVGDVVRAALQPKQ